MRWSIRYRLLVPLGLLLLGVVATSTWSALLAANHAEKRIARQMQSVIGTMEEANYPLAPNVLEQMKGLSGADFLLVSPDKTRLSTFSTTAIELPRDELFQYPALPDADPLGPPAEVNGQRYLSRRLLLRRSPNEGATLYVFYPTTLLNDAIWDAVRPSLVLGLFGGFAAVAVAVVIGQRLVSRIRDLGRRTRLIASGDFSPMPLPRQADELRDLSQSVNEMAARLAQLQEAVQRSERLRLAGQLSSGLAHQLRNSATGARLALQVMVEELGLQKAEAVAVILRQLSLMEANLRRFMDLGRTEGWKRERCSLPRLIDEAVSLLRPQCEHAGTKLSWQSPSDALEIDGDSNQLRDLLLNVINNAIEAAGPSGAVEIQLSSSGEPKATRAIIEVFDTGAGPAPAIAARLFEPFVTSKPEGIGLGLAVARQAAEAHGGSLDWRRDAGRTCFWIELPL